MTADRLLYVDGPGVSAIGMGTWAIGGPSTAGDQPLGWGSSWQRKGAASVLRAAFDAGTTVFDTSDAYGAGTAERLIGETLAPVRDEIAIVSKWGNLVDEAGRRLTGTDSSPDYIRTALDSSLARLRTDRVELYLLHLSGLAADVANEMLGTLQDLVEEGKIGAYGWSTDEPELAAAWMGNRGFGALEFEVNVINDAPALVAMSDEHAVPSLARGPLATGLLGGAYGAGSRITDVQDFRFRSPDWLSYFSDGRPVTHYVRRLEAVTEILRSGGRTVPQGALCWLLARSPNLIPIPGAQTVDQAIENAGALRFGPLSGRLMAEIDQLIGDAEARA